MKNKERISSFARYCWRWLHSRYFIEWLRHIFIAPFGCLRKPVEVKYEKSYNGRYYPVCPHCGNMPYDEDFCYFCGQRFSNIATILEFPEGPIPCTVAFSDGANLSEDEERTEDGTVQSTAAKLAKLAFEAGVTFERSTTMHNNKKPLTLVEIKKPLVTDDDGVAALWCEYRNTGSLMIVLLSDRLMLEHDELLWCEIPFENYNRFFRFWEQKPTPEERAAAAWEDPVVHGRWLTSSDIPDTLICSVCGKEFDMYHFDQKDMPYCLCGAKMDGGTSDGKS